MAFNFYCKGYNLVFGPGSETTVVERYVFDGWTDEERKKKFLGSVGFWETEARAGRADPSLRTSGIYAIEEVATSRPYERNTPIGLILEVSYGKQYCNTAVLEDLFAKSGIAVHRADPFLKPMKTPWQLIKEKFSRK